MRVRVVGRTDSLRDAVRIGNEVETLYLNGPAGGGGVTKSAREVVAIASVLLPRELGGAVVQFVGAEDAAARDRPFPNRRQGRHLEHLGHRL